MNAAGDKLNQDLLALTESFANAVIGPAEFRRRRREIICQWTGQPVPQVDVSAPSEDDTHPGMKAITDKDVRDAARAPAAEPAAVAAEPSGKSIRWGLWVTVLLLLFAFSGAGALVWFVLRRSA
jgi:hypothetical protein